MSDGKYRFVLSDECIHRGLAIGTAWHNDPSVSEANRFLAVLVSSVRIFRIEQVWGYFSRLR